MDLLIAHSAVERLGARLLACDPAIRLLQLDQYGQVRMNGRECAESEVRPDVAWLSLDIFAQAQLGRFIGFVERCASIQWLHTVHAGLDLPFYSSLLERKVRLSNSHVHAPAIAEYVLGHVLALFQLHDRFRQSQLERRWQPLGFRELGRSRWLIVGIGNVGTQIANRAMSLGAQVVGVRRRDLPHPGIGQVVAIGELRRHLPDADVVVLCCPLARETQNLVNADFLAAMKTGSILVNVARGALVDEVALLEGLDRGRPGCAVLDVTAFEPLPSDSPLWTHHNVRLTAHSAFAGSGTEGRGDELFLENLHRYCTGKPLLEEITTI
jgi:phosphoglycerate dehydrogenase-like enzyme